MDEFEPLAVGLGPIAQRWIISVPTIQAVLKII
jgi:hypothetical protein